MYREADFLPYLRLRYSVSPRVVAFVGKAVNIVMLQGSHNLWSNQEIPYGFGTVLMLQR